MLDSTSKFKVVEIIFNDGEFAIAKGFWDGGNRLSVACRWHAEGIGYPQTFGKAQWMMLPSPIVDIEDALNPERSKVTLVFDPAVSATVNTNTSDSPTNSLA